MIYWFCFFKQKTAYELRISDWSSDVCSSDLRPLPCAFGPGFDHRTSASIAPCRMKAAAALSTRSARLARLTSAAIIARSTAAVDQRSSHSRTGRARGARLRAKARVLWVRSEEHTSELQSLMRISYAVFCLQKK